MTKPTARTVAVRLPGHLAEAVTARIQAQDQTASRYIRQLIEADLGLHTTPSRLTTLETRVDEMQDTLEAIELMTDPRLARHYVEDVAES